MQRLLSDARDARLFSAAEVRELDRIAIEERGVPGIVLMKRAGLAVFKAMSKLDPSLGAVTVLCGRGNNAGDGYIIAGLAVDHGVDVQLLQLGSSDALRGDAALARDWARERGVVEEPFHSSSELRGAVLVDALLGTGLTGEVREEFGAAIDAINRAGRPIVSVKRQRATALHQCRSQQRTPGARERRDRRSHLLRPSDRSAPRRRL